MPDTTKLEDDSGFIGLTVVPASLNASTPHAATMAPRAATIADISVLAGKTNPYPGIAQAVSHINAAVKMTSSSGGILSSSMTRLSLHVGCPCPLFLPA